MNDIMYRTLRPEDFAAVGLVLFCAGLLAFVAGMMLGRRQGFRSA